MPLAFGAHLGGTLTLISTPPNLLVSDALREAGRNPFQFFSFIVPGAAVLVVGVAYVALVGRRALPKGNKPGSLPGPLTEHELASEYGLGHSLRALRLLPASKLIGRTLAASELRERHGITVVAVIRSGESLAVVPSLVFAARDELRILGSDLAIDAVVSEFGAERSSGPPMFSLPLEESLAEIVLPRRSRLVGHTLRAAKFRDRYRATVLGIRRIDAGRPVCHTQGALRDLELRSGDTLLVKGRRKYLRNLHQERDDVVLVAEPDITPGILLDRPRAVGAVVITMAMLVVMAFGWVPNVIAVLTAAVALLLAQSVRPADVYRFVNWESIVLIAGMIPLATVLEQSGGTELLVMAVERHLSGASPLMVLALLVGITSALGMVLSNTATAVLLAPIGLRMANVFGIAPEPLLMGVAFAASAAFATPIASPVNVLVMTPGDYRFKDYVKVGLPLQLLVLATAVLVIPLAWPF